MRLTCPNCAAQYEVPEDVIPAEGRDVQCSNCGQTWFQPAAGSPPADESETAGAAPAAEPEPAPQPDPAPQLDAPAPAAQAAETAPPEDGFEEDAAAPGSWAEDGAAEAEAEAGDAPRSDPAPQRSRSLDPAMSDILREEAEREAALRAKEAQSIETQPDLGLEEPRRTPAAPASAAAEDDDAAMRSREARDRMARLRGEDPRLAAAAESGKRRELLPDIEEINSTLRASGTGAAAAQPDDGTPAPRRASSFARGFTLSVAAGLLLVLVYDKAPMIAESLPQAEPALSSYVGWVDQARLWLDAQVQGLTAQ